MTITIKSLIHERSARSIERGSYEVISDVRLSESLLLVLGREWNWTGQTHTIMSNERCEQGWRAVVSWVCDSSD